MKSKIHVMLMCLIFMLPIIKAQETTSILRHYIQQALDSNTDILSSQLASEAALQERHIASALPDPALMFEGRGIPLDLSRFGETRELMFMIEQMFPPLGTLAGLQQREEFAADIKDEMQRAVELDIIRQVKQLYYQIVYLDVALRTNKEHARLLIDLAKIAESKYVVNQTQQHDLYEIKIEQAQLDAEQASLKEKRATRTATLNRLLNRDLETVIQVDSILATPIQLDFNQLEQLLEESNPFLAAARIRIESSINDVDLARANKRPVVKVMGGYMAMNNADDALMGRLGMTLPFMPWSSKDTRAAVEKSRVLKYKADVDYQTLRDNLAVKLLESLNSLYALDNQIDLYDTQIIPASEQTVSLSLTRYQADKLDFLSLIQYTREKLQHQLQREKLVSDYWQNIAQLEYAVGRDFQEVIK